MLDFIKGVNRYYIVAPANFATGGPELLHQLAYKLKKNGKNVSILYIPTNNPSPVHENYKQYEIDFVRELDDDEQNVLIVPETQTQLLNNYAKIKKIIWWLSVDNHFLSLPGLKGRINRLLLNRLDSQHYFFFNSRLKAVDFHLVQSDYAKDCLKSKGINNFAFLSDYLHESFLKEQINLDGKKNLVVYNPQKGFKFTRKLINASPNIEFVAIEKMTREEVIELLKKAKVYIDFGFHPGKDRIPREAAFLKCCVITNKRGSANFYKDVPINDDFKFEESIAILNSISNKIDDCFNNYAGNLVKFEDYRQEIKRQEREFDEQLKDLFL